MTPLPDLHPSTIARPSGAVRLSDWGVIRAKGVDAAKFLQGQLTQDVLSLALGEARLAGYCSAKGRMLASFIVWKAGPEEFWLACSADLLPATLKRLSMFVLRAQCQLTDASAAVQLWGLAGEAAMAWLSQDGAPWSEASLQGGQAVRLPDAQGTARWLWAGPASPEGHSANDGPENLPRLSEAAWQTMEVASGVVRIVAATVEAFVPQMVNFELVGGVNFKKGCYPGQEVVARSQYRGTVKRRAILFGSAQPAHAGQPVFHSADPSQPAGTVALAAGNTALVEIKRAALLDGSLHLESVQGPVLTPMPMPYTLPTDEA